MAQVTAADVFYDLGSGDGSVVIAAAKRGARAIGVEIQPDLVEQSRQNIKASNVRAEIRQGDLATADFSDATVVFLAVSAQAHELLKPKLKNLKPGSRIVTLRYPIPGWTPDERHGNSLFLWRIK